MRYGYGYGYGAYDTGSAYGYYSDEPTTDKLFEPWELI